MTSRRDAPCVLGFVLLLSLFLGVPSTLAQEARFDVGGGWAFPIDNVEQEVEVTIETQDGPLTGTITQPVDLHAGRHVYVGAGFVRSIGEKFALGARLRAHRSELSSTVDCQFGTCTSPDGSYRAATVEGRLIVTAPEWIRPYLLVGLGIVHASVEKVTAQNIEDSRLPSSLTYPAVSVVDAGGDIGIGASVPVIGSLYVDGEFRVTGALPGGKDNAVTVLPFSLGLSYGL